MGKYLVLSSYELSRYASRSCTDTWAFFVYILFLSGMTVITIFLSLNSNPETLLHGIDYNGRICGSLPVPGNLTINSQKWEILQYLWYPFQFNSSTENFFKDANLIGICVKQCPSVGDLVTTYGGSINFSTKFLVQFNSSELLWRCIPKIDTFNCDHNVSCKDKMNLIKSIILSFIQIENLFFGLLKSLHDYWTLYFVMFFLSIFFSFLWVCFMRCAVKSVLAIIIVLFFLGIMTFGNVALYNFYTISTNLRYLWLSIGILSFLIGSIYACILIYLRKNILAACSIIEEASKVIIEVPSILFIPILNSIFMSIICIFFIFNIIMLYSFPNLTNKTISWDDNIFHVTTKGSTDYWIISGYFYSLFIFIWSISFIHAIGTLIISLTVTQWYWSGPGYMKDTPKDAVRWSVSKIVRYHMGTVALGSLLITFVRVFRWTFYILENILGSCFCSESLNSFSFCCCRCYFSCFESILCLLTKNAYSVTAFLGEPLFPAARIATNLLLRDSKILKISFISNVLIFGTKAIISIIVTLLSLLWILYSSNRKDIESSILATFICLSVISYFITSLFTDIFITNINTILICFCYDQVVNKGADRFFFVPEGLEKLMEELSIEFRQRSSTLEQYLIQNDGNVRFL